MRELFYRFSPRHRRIRLLVNEFERRREMSGQCPSFAQNCSTFEFYIALLVPILYGHMGSSKNRADRTEEALVVVKFFALVFFSMALKKRGDTLSGDPADHPEFKTFLDSMNSNLSERAKEYEPYLDPATNIIWAIAHLGEACELRLTTSSPTENDVDLKFFLRVLLPVEMRLTYVEAMTGFRERMDRESLTSMLSNG